MGLTRKGFEAWLRSKDDFAFVGRRCKEFYCPLATYLHEQGYPRAEVSDINYVLDKPAGGFALIPLRRWAVRFVRAIDRSPLAPLDEHVTAGEARALLSAIKGRF